MKTARSHIGARRREQVLDAPRQDAYRAKEKLKGAAHCRDCGAVYARGRWAWSAAQPGSRATLCPACRRARDGMPAGYVSLAGEFYLDHRDEVLRRVRRCEAAERKAHPLQRILEVRERGGTAVVTTSDSHLARRIGEALGKSFKGAVRYRYAPGDNRLRVEWSR